MRWQIEYSAKAKKQLQKLDQSQKKLIIAWIEKNLVGCENPRSIGKALSGDKSNWWRYRIGTYRLLTTFQDDKLLILVIQVGHRKDVYR